MIPKIREDKGISCSLRIQGSLVVYHLFPDLLILIHRLMINAASFGVKEHDQPATWPITSIGVAAMKKVAVVQACVASIQLNRNLTFGIDHLFNAV